MGHPILSRCAICDTYVRFGQYFRFQMMNRKYWSCFGFRLRRAQTLQNNNHSYTKLFLIILPFYFVAYRCIVDTVKTKITFGDRHQMTIENKHETSVRGKYSFKIKSLNTYLMKHTVAWHYNIAISKLKNVFSNLWFYAFFQF